MGWRYTLFTLGGVTLFAFLMRFAVFRFQESPKFLLYRGQDEKAVEVLCKIAKFNGRESTISLDIFNALTDEEASFRSGESGTVAILGAGSKQARTSFGQKVQLELSRYKLLFANAAIARMTILVWITYIFDYWGFSVAGWCMFLFTDRSALILHEQDPSSQLYCWPRMLRSTCPSERHTAIT